VLAACGGRSEGPASAPADTTTPPVPPAPAAGPTSSAAPRISGSISVLRAGAELAASASFPLAGSDAAEALGPGCALRTSNGSALVSVSAGTVVVDVTGGSSLKLSYDATTRAYENATFEGAVPAGSPLAIHASGSADVPAFDTTITAAAEATLIEPSEGTSIGQDAADLDVTWTPMEEPIFVVSVQLANTTIACRFGSSTGHGVVPSALLRQAVKASGGTACAGSCASVSVFTGHTTQVTAGAYDVFVTGSAVSSRALTLAR
jgi:hypothetical protein